MKIRFFIIPLFLLCLFSCSKKLSDAVIISRASSLLDSSKTVTYDVLLESFWDGIEDFNAVHKVHSYLDWSKADSTIVDLKYRFIYDSPKLRGEHLYDEHKQLFVDYDKKVIYYTKRPVAWGGMAVIGMSKSMHDIKLMLSAGKNDSTIVFSRQKDTIVDGKKCYLFNIKMPNQRFGYDGLVPEKNETPYTIAIAKESFIPTYFFSESLDYRSYSTAVYTNVRFNEQLPKETWSVARFPKEYTREFRQMQIESAPEIAVDLRSETVSVKAPSWRLPSLAGDTVALSDLKGKLVLLEFWFPYCQACIASVPHVNEIAERYKDKGLVVYGVEYTNRSEMALSKYVGKYNIRTPTLHSGKEVAEAYFVAGAPSFILINQQGDIVHAQLGLDKQKLIEEIENSLK